MSNDRTMLSIMNEFEYELLKNSKYYYKIDEHSVRAAELALQKVLSRHCYSGNICFDREKGYYLGY